jgi:hypothetical protein
MLTFPESLNAKIAKDACALEPTSVDAEERAIFLKRNNYLWLWRELD